MANVQVQSWLENGASYATGVKLYERYGSNKTMLGLFLRGENVFTRKTLKQELLKIKADVNEEIPQLKVSRKTETKSKKQYGRLNKESYPTELHVAYDRQNKCYAYINHYQPQLELLEKEQCKVHCLGIVEATKEIDAIYNLLDYWQKNKVILPNKYVPESQIIVTDRAELVKQRSRLRSQVSKQKNNPKRQTEVEGWKKEIEKLTFTIDSYVVQ